MPTEAKPQPATSLYLQAPIAIRANPTIIIMNVAHAKTVFLFIPIVYSFMVLLFFNYKGWQRPVAVIK